MQIYSLESEVMRIDVSDLGARIINWDVNINGVQRDIVLRYPSLKEYDDDVFYIGAVAGPYANRIRHGIVQTENGSLNLTCNSGEHHLHGGNRGFDKQIWRVVEHNTTRIVMQLVVSDDVDGYPGPATYTVEYGLEGRALTLSMTGTSQKQTVMGPTGHSYFNLNGASSGTCGLLQWLSSNAAGMTPKDEDGLPTGPVIPLAESPYNVSSDTLLDELSAGKQLDHNFVFDGVSQQTTLMSHVKDLALTVTSSYPAAQFYTGYYLGGSVRQHQGICIEPHFGADAPNQLPSRHGLIDANVAFKQHITYEITLL